MLYFCTVNTVPAHGFSSREISDMNEGIIEGSVDMSHTEHQLSLPDLRTQGNLDLLLILLLSLSRSHFYSFLSILKQIKNNKKK